MSSNPHVITSLDALIDEILAEELNSMMREPGDLSDPSLYKDNEPPVDVLTFVDDPYLSGDPVNFQPAVREILWDIEDPDIREVDLAIGKGSGKSEICITSQLYGAYVLSRMKDPHGFLGLASHNLLASINVSISERQAKDVIFQGLRHKIESSPYFRSLSPDILTQEIRFPGNITLFCGHSGSKAFLGYATIRAVMDEVNYMYDSSKRSQAEELHRMLSGSMKTRAPNHYKLIDVSSVTLGSTWQAQRVKQAQTEGVPYIRRVPMDVKVITTLPNGTKILEVTAEHKYPQDEVARTLDTEHQLDVVKIFPWEEFDGCVKCTVQARAQVIRGL